jgi:hypothetical protein
MRKGTQQLLAPFGWSLQPAWERRFRPSLRDITIANGHGAHPNRPTRVVNNSKPPYREVAPGSRLDETIDHGLVVFERNDHPKEVTMTITPSSRRIAPTASTTKGN